MRNRDRYRRAGIDPKIGNTPVINAIVKTQDVMHLNNVLTGFQLFICFSTSILPLLRFYRMIRISPLRVRRFFDGLCIILLCFF